MSMHAAVVRSFDHPPRYEQYDTNDSTTNIRAATPESWAARPSAAGRLGAEIGSALIMSENMAADPRPAHE